MTEYSTTTGFTENEISVNASGGTELTKRGLAKALDPKLLEHFQIICSRVRDLAPDKIRVYWVHDLPQDPECSKLQDENFRNQFHLIVFTSEYQYLQFRNVLGLPYSEKFLVLPSCIDPIDVVEKPKDKINLIYTSTPQRGLGLLIPAVDFLSKRHPEIHLDVFSSFKIYGWEERDAHFEPMYQTIREHSNMTYHGFTGPNQDVVREHLAKAHIFAYPCTWDETFCRSLVEAMSAECLCVHPNFAALPFTSGGLNIMYPGDEDNQKHVNVFLNYLNIAIEMHKNAGDALKHRLGFNKAFVDTLYSTGYVASRWKTVLEKLLTEFPDEASRKPPGHVLTFKTS